jgi:membrane-bound serine protease (ClpP class)
MPLLYVNAWTIIIIAIILVVFFIFAAIWGVRAHRRQVVAGKEDLVGRTAIVEIALEPKGVVLVEGERWTAITDKGRAEPEEEVIITKVEGLKLRVTKKEP